MPKAKTHYSGPTTYALLVLVRSEKETFFPFTFEFFFLISLVIPIFEKPWLPNEAKKQGRCLCGSSPLFYHTKKRFYVEST